MSELLSIGPPPCGCFQPSGVFIADSRGIGAVGPVSSRTREDRRPPDPTTPLTHRIAHDAEAVRGPESLMVRLRNPHPAGGEGLNHATVALGVVLAALLAIPAAAGAPAQASDGRAAP